MEQWKDQGIVLGARPHGEGGAVVSLLTESHGRHAGYVRGAQSSKTRGVIEPGNLVDVQWSSRVAENLGAFNLELSHAYSAYMVEDRLRLMAMLSACALCDESLPEREGHEGLFHGLVALFEVMESDMWAPAYVMWEVALLRELGFSIDLTCCAGGGSAEDLAYVSPKTGKAVSAEMGEPYKEKLLALPDFLKPGGGSGDEGEVCKGLALTGYFLEHWVFNHHSRGIPEARLSFGLRYAQSFATNEDHTKLEEEYESGQ